MNTQSYVIIPTTTADKLAKLGRAMLELAQEMQQNAGLPTSVKRLRIPKEQAWFWREEWQQGEREADEALARGNYKDFDKVEELIADLHAHL